MRLAAVSLVAAVSVTAWPLHEPDNQVSFLTDDLYDKCTIIRDHAGDTIYDCPGCTLILDRHGKIKLRTGDKCSKYCDHGDKDKDKKSTITSHKDGCQVIKQPNGDTLTQCPGCQRIVDKDGNTKLEQGPNCNGSKGCQTIRQPNGDTIIQCPGCQRIIDKNGKTKLEQGPNCKHRKDDDDDADADAIFGEAYENEGLIVQ